MTASRFRHRLLALADWHRRLSGTSIQLVTVATAIFNRIFFILFQNGIMCLHMHAMPQAPRNSADRPIASTQCRSPKVVSFLLAAIPAVHHGSFRWRKQKGRIQKSQMVQELASLAS